MESSVASPFAARTAASVAFLAAALDRRIPVLAELDPEAGLAVEKVGELACGGKHIRATLVHVAADRPAGDPPREDVVVGAAFDLMHAGFLVLDDVIDRDDFRRGKPALHAVIRDRAHRLHGLDSAGHHGNSVAALAGCAALNSAIRMVAGCGADSGTVRDLVLLVTACANDSITGEFLDIHHSLPGVEPSPGTAEYATELKTAAYTFQAPLAAGAIVAGRRGDVRTLSEIGRHLGLAYQLGDDINSITQNKDESGKDPLGDILHARATLLQEHASRIGVWDSVVAAAHETDDPRGKVEKILLDSGTIAAVTGLRDEHVRRAEQLIASGPDHGGPALSRPARDSLAAVAAAIRGHSNA
ncbi:polyprenyl synthetase family protein [Corynebacterium mendelii]|uniref:Polyprenyl synthetase family protein n=1 Tax=Corynebacterium mendelii TaxID=2765362 RepID=A0A939E202_9CORY|nr:polyprenyl synthetase family protein [Corynebacterium mendelii]MBN9644221.1 polyprenyl synthetase family protein [Corynebacterium mendelii]